MDLNSNSTGNYEIFGEILNPEGIADIKELKFKGVIILLKSCLLLCEAEWKIHGDSLFGGGGGEWGLNFILENSNYPIVKLCQRSKAYANTIYSEVKNECKMNPVGRVIRPEGETSIDCNGDTKGLLRY